MPLEAVTETSAGQAPERTVRAEPPVLAAVAEVAELVLVADGASNRAGESNRSTEMRSRFSDGILPRLAWAMSAAVLASVCTPALFAAQPPKTNATAPAAAVTSPKTFSTPDDAAKALVNAAANFDETALTEIFGSHGTDIIFTGEVPYDRQRAAGFAAQARQKMSVSLEPQNGTRAYLLVGNEEWPFPVPIVKSGGRWSFDIDAGRQELLYRRIGANELDAIHICDGFVEAQYDYAYKKRDGYQVNQYAQRIVSTPGQQDGLAWQNKDGSWGGPVGQKIAQAIAEGYSSRDTSYHGYYFKVLKGQGPDAPLGQLDYVIKGVMIGGFALVASPAEYRVTGVKTFMVSQDGVVWQKDLGPTTLDQFKAMDRFNPDKSWTPVEDNP
jgi:Protein of unknown function (DUF2950)